MRKICVVLCLLLLIGCTSKQRIIEGIDLNKGILVESIDTRGWFNDGEVCEQYDFSNHPIQSFNKPFIPLDDSFHRLINDYIHDELFDGIKEGYYYLVDKQESKEDLFERSSMNIEMIIYDIINNQLYYIALNT